MPIALKEWLAKAKLSKIPLHQYLTLENVREAC